MLLISFFGISAISQEDVIRINTDLIGFEVTVFDEKGFPVRGLREQDFRIFENGLPRKIDFFESVRKESENKRPLSIVFALDTSGSITSEELLKLRDAMQQFVNRLADYNSYFAVMSFGMEVKTLQGFTNKPEKLQKTFRRLLKDSSGLSTHAYDAVDDAVRLIRKKAPLTSKNQSMRRVVILVTDGFPVGDIVAPQTVIERANASETSVYTVILPSFSRLQGNRKPLLTPLEISGLAEKTGGGSFYAGAESYEPLFRSLERDISASYRLAFYPNREGIEAKREDKYYEVKIETSAGFKVKQNRTGYRLPK